MVLDIWECRSPCRALRCEVGLWVWIADLGHSHATHPDHCTIEYRSSDGHACPDGFLRSEKLIRTNRTRFFYSSGSCIPQCRCPVGTMGATVGEKYHSSNRPCWSVEFSVTSRAREMSFIVGKEVGVVITTPLAGLLCASTFLGGWPSAFYVFGRSTNGKVG